MTSSAEAGTFRQDRHVWDSSHATVGARPIILRQTEACVKSSTTFTPRRRTP
jgi:hypothetical protein